MNAVNEFFFREKVMHLGIYALFELIEIHPLKMT